MSLRSAEIPQRNSSRAGKSHWILIPRAKTPQAGRKIYQFSKGISIDNYDPKERKPFTDPLTIAAMRNLGIQAEELYFPLESEILKYTKEPKLKPVVIKHLEERLKETQNLVRDERDRIATKPPRNQVKRNTTPSTSSKNFVQQELDKLSKFEKASKNQAATMILTILVEKEMQKEAQALEEKLIERDKQREKMLEETKKERLQKSQEKMMEIEESKRAENRKLMKKASEKEKHLLQNKKILEEHQKEKFKQDDEERKRKNQQAKELALENEKLKEVRYIEQAKILEEKIEKVDQRRLEKQKEFQEANRQKEEAFKLRVEAIRHQQLMQLNLKRKAIDEKDSRVQQNLAFFQKLQMEKSKHFQERQQNSLEKTENMRLQRQKEREEKIKKAEDIYQARNVEEYDKRKKQEKLEWKKRHIGLQMKLEENLLRSKRILESQKTANAESIDALDRRIQAIDEMKKMDELNRMENEKTKKLLEAKKFQIKQENIEIERKIIQASSEKKLKGLAQSLDIDFNLLKKQAESIAKRGQKTNVEMDDDENSHQKDQKPKNSKSSEYLIPNNPFFVTEGGASTNAE